MEPVVIEKKSVQYWKQSFGDAPVRIVPQEQPLIQAWENMGIAYGRIQLQKQKYKRAGMGQSVVAINEKMQEKIKDLEDRTIELMGYPRLQAGVSENLKKLAQADGLHLNVYALSEYQKIPPPIIADAIMEAKQYFDAIEVWAIEQTAYVRPLKDPAVIGYVMVNSYTRIPYLVATWGDDIQTEDLIGTKKLT